MIKRDFHRFVSAEAIRSSGYHSDLVVESLDGAGGNLAFSSEPVQQEFLMGAKHAGDFLQGIQTAAHGPITPIVQKGSGPEYGLVMPEVKESFLQLPGSCLSIPSRVGLTVMKMITLSPLNSLRDSVAALFSCHVVRRRRMKSPEKRDF